MKPLRCELLGFMHTQLGGTIIIPVHLRLRDLQCPQEPTLLLNNMGQFIDIPTKIGQADAHSEL